MSRALEVWRRAMSPTRSNPGGPPPKPLSDPARSEIDDQPPKAPEGPLTGDSGFSVQLRAVGYSSSTSLATWSCSSEFPPLAPARRCSPVVGVRGRPGLLRHATRCCPAKPTRPAVARRGRPRRTVCVSPPQVLFRSSDTKHASVRLQAPPERSWALLRGRGWVHPRPPPGATVARR